MQTTSRSRVRSARPGNHLDGDIPLQGKDYLWKTEKPSVQVTVHYGPYGALRVSYHTEVHLDAVLKEETMVNGYIKGETIYISTVPYIEGI